MKNTIKKYLKQEKFIKYVIDDYLSKVKFMIVDNVMGDIWVKFPQTDRPLTVLDVTKLRLSTSLPYFVIKGVNEYGLFIGNNRDDYDIIKNLWGEVLRMVSIKINEISKNKDSYEINQLISINESENKKNRFKKWLLNNVKAPYYNTLKLCGLAEDDELLDNFFSKIFGSDYYYYQLDTIDWNEDINTLNIFNNSNELIYRERVTLNKYWFFKYNTIGNTTYREDHDLNRKMSNYRYWFYDEDNNVIDHRILHKPLTYEEVKIIAPEGSVLREEDYTPWI